MIKAIETHYKGYRFRSRLEARWAVFFDALGTKWEYEKEGFDLGEYGWYLPDFYLSNYSWVEIKPRTVQKLDVSDINDYQKFSEIRQAWNKCMMLAFYLKQPTAIIYGNPWPEEYIIELFAHNYPFPATLGCDYCFGPYGTLVKQKHAKTDGELHRAYTAARSARFEHGESPLLVNSIK